MVTDELKKTVSTDLLGCRRVELVRQPVNLHVGSVGHVLHGLL
jgi:hypothetical protein